MARQRRGEVRYAPLVGEGLGARSATERSELPIIANEHALDATRYALHSALRQVNIPAAWMSAWVSNRRPETTSGSFPC